MSGGLWSTAIDPVQFENALLNLAINARDAMDGAGKLTIEVNNACWTTVYCAAHPDVAPGQYVMIGVSDTGAGMAPEVLNRAFEPFFSTKAEGKGTGLGLSMVYGLVKQSGGHVKIYSEVGEGTTVKLYLPRSHEAEDALCGAGHPAGGRRQRDRAGGRGRRSRARHRGRHPGRTRLPRAEGARRQRRTDVIDSGVAIDLLFTDVVMPGPLRSPELARKAKERLPELAVLFTSGYTENAIVHGGRLDRGVELMGKPYTAEHLARKIRHVLANEKQKRVGKLPEAPPAQPEAVAAFAAPAQVLNILLVEDEHPREHPRHDRIPGPPRVRRRHGGRSDAEALGRHRPAADRPAPAGRAGRRPGPGGQGQLPAHADPAGQRLRQYGAGGGRGHTAQAVHAG
jgi:CheY-like chemotaxis protein